MGFYCDGTDSDSSMNSKRDRYFSLTGKDEYVNEKYCLVCKVCISCRVVSHLKKEEHLKKATSILQGHKCYSFVEEIRKKTNLCVPCNYYFRERRFFEHVDSTWHQHRVNIVMKRYEDEFPDFKEIDAKTHIKQYCELCDRFVNNNHFSMKQHVDGHRHRARLDVRKTKKENEADYSCIVKTYRGNSRTWVEQFCKICRCYISNNKYNIVEHVEGASHQSKLEKCMYDLSGLIEVYDFYSVKKRYCLDCECYVPNAKIDMILHVKSAEH